MASNIGTSDVFTTSNIKPDSGEVINAVTHQNLAANTGYNFYSNIFAGEVNMSQTEPTFFIKTPAHNGIRLYNVFDTDEAGTITFDAVEIVSGGTDATGTKIKSPFSGIGWFDFDISGLSTGSHYALFFSYSVTTPPSAGGPGDSRIWLIHGSGANH